MQIPFQRDDRGAFLTVGLEVADDLRTDLSRRGVAFREEHEEDCGCAGPSVAVFRFVEPVSPEQRHYRLEADRIAEE